MLSRRQILAAALATPMTARGATAQREALGMTLSEDQLAAGRALLKAVPSVDVHSHPGRFFMAGPGGQTPFAASQDEPPFVDRAIARMRLGHVSGVMFAAVADHLLLEQSPTGLRAIRDYRPGEAFADYQRQLALLKALVKQGEVTRGLTSRDIRAAHARGRTACIFSVEGGDYIEDRLDRVAKSYADGVRSVTIIHYYTNQIGDPQTAPPTHGGLTPLGRDVVKEMNRVGMLVDLSHASFDATRQAVEMSSRPMIISHSNLQAPGLDHPRLVSVEHAKLVTAAGGLIGALPAGAGQGSFAQYVDTIFRMVDLLGVDHVAVGTDMDFTFKAVVADYADWGLIPAGLLARGMGRAEVAKVIGGNFLRLFDAVRV